MSIAGPAGHSYFLEAAYLGEDHGRDLLGGEGLGLAEVFNLDDGVARAALLDNLEGPRLNVLLDNGVAEGPANQSPIEKGYQCTDPAGAGPFE